MSTKQHTTFGEWMRQIDLLLEIRLNLHSDDLPDFLWRDAYDEEQDTAEAVNNALEWMEP